MYTKICVVGDVLDVITYAKFQNEIFRGYNFTGGWIFNFSYWFWMGLTTVQRYCAACERCREGQKLVIIIIIVFFFFFFVTDFSRQFLMNYYRHGHSSCTARTFMAYRCAFWGFCRYCVPFRESNPQKKHPKGAWISILSQTRKTLKLAYYQNHCTGPTKFCKTIKTTKYSSCVIQTRLQQIQAGVRLPSCKVNKVLLSLFDWSPRNLTHFYSQHPIGR